MKKSQALMCAAIEAYRSGGPDGFRAYFRGLTQYDHATLAVLGNGLMQGMGMIRDDYSSERRCEVFIRACVEGIPLAIGRRLRGRRRKRPAP